jgi:adenylylsulfate kinase-like enzyme
VADIIGKDRYQEVHVDAPLEWCEQHDTTGLYRKAKEGEVRNLAGVNTPYEAPSHPYLRVSLVQTGIEDTADRILKALRKDGIFPVKK